MLNKRILMAGVVCALITVVTTFVVHLVEVPSATFEERLQLTTNTTYIGRNTLTIVHCLCVAISMAAVAVAHRGKPGQVLVRWGAVSFLIFAVVEITRMLTALVFINGLRSQYLLSENASQQELIRFTLEVQWPLAGTVMFVLFIIAFGLGCLFTGLGMIDRDDRFSTAAGVLFIAWAGLSFVTIGNSQLGWGLDSAIHWLSITFQPSMRLLIAAWLFRAARSGRLT